MLEHRRDAPSDRVVLVSSSTRVLDIFEALARLRSLEAMGYVTGVVDDRGKFIFISRDELQAVDAQTDDQSQPLANVALGGRRSELRRRRRLRARSRRLARRRARASSAL